MAEQQKFVEAISEKTLDEVAGGLKLDKATVKKALIGAGVAILGIGATTGGLVYAGSKGKGPMKKLFNKGQSNTTSTTTGSSAASTGSAMEEAQRDYMNERDMDDI